MGKVMAQRSAACESRAALALTRWVRNNLWSSRRSGMRSPGQGSHCLNDCTRELFAQHGLRCTRQRQTLFETLRACRCHPTAEELYRMLPCSGGMSRATVYNTLETLCSEIGRASCRKRVYTMVV